MWLNPHITLESTQDSSKDALASAVTWDGIYLPIEFYTRNQIWPSPVTTTINAAAESARHDIITARWKPGALISSGTPLEYDLCAKETFVSTAMKGDTTASDAKGPCGK
jgi:hypothetical protein